MFATGIWKAQGVPFARTVGVDGAESRIEEPHRVAMIDLAARSDSIRPAGRAAVDSAVQSWGKGNAGAVDGDYVELKTANDV